MYLRTNNHKQGKLIIFLHGVGSSSHMWEKHLATFSEYNCIAPDLPGHGKSNLLSWTTLDDVANQIYKLVIDSGYKQAHFVGLSLGGSLIINLLGRHPEVIDRAVVDGAGTIPIKCKNIIKLAVKLISPFIKFNTVNAQIAKSLGVTDPQELNQFRSDMKAVSPLAFRAAFAQANDQLEPKGIKDLNKPVLFVAGEQEVAETKASNTQLANTINGSRAEVVMGVGHGWVVKKPELHIIMVRNWIKSN